MGFLTPDFTRYFKDLPDGRSVFYPRGPGSRGYQIADWRLRDRIERRLRFVHFLNLALMLGVSQAVVRAPGRWWWLATIFLPPHIEGWLMRSAAEGLNESDEPYTPAERFKRVLDKARWGGLLALLAISLIFLLGGAWMLTDGPQWRKPGAGVVALGAACTAASVWLIRRKRQLEDEKYRIPGSRKPTWQ